MICKNIIYYVLLLALSITLIELHALVCPEAGKQVKFEGLPQGTIDLFRTQCSLQPDSNTGFFKPVKSISMKSSQKFGTYTAGINMPSSYESDTSSEAS